MTFHFKQKSQDFYVSEQLPFKLAWKGDAFYVYFEKRNLTTHEVIQHLRKRFNISRLTLGIAGLKDKKAIAKQRISIYDRALKKLGGERVFVEALEEIVKVIKTDRHHTPLNLSTPISNSFHITFRSSKKLGQDERAQAKKIVEGLLVDGYPNLFGEQRFGIDGRNSTQWREIMTGVSKETFNKVDTVFKLQAYVSKLFNEYAQQRIDEGRQVIDGDILTRVHKGKTQRGIFQAANYIVIPCDIRSENREFFFVPMPAGEEVPYLPDEMCITWPVPGYNMPIPAAASVSGKEERTFLKKNKATQETMKIYKELRIFGLRRAIWVMPTQTQVRYQGDDLLIDFTLPAGAYASIVFDQLEDALA